MAILKMKINGEEKQMEVYSIADLLQLIDVKQKVIEALLRQNAELREKVNAEQSGEVGVKEGRVC